MPLEENDSTYSLFFLSLFLCRRDDTSFIDINNTIRIRFCILYNSRYGYEEENPAYFTSFLHSEMIYFFCKDAFEGCWNNRIFKDALYSSFIFFDTIFRTDLLSKEKHLYLFGDSS